VEVLSNRVEFNAPGGGRPTLVRYKIRIRDEARVGHLGLDEAEALLGDLDAAWGPDRIFEEIAARGGALDPAEK
jgi:predicted ArsR family transcriptional regulator